MIPKPGDRVRISEAYHWAKGASATVANPPDFITSLGDGYVAWWREVDTLKGRRVFLFVEFDEPHDDGSGDGPYVHAEIDLEYLEPEEE